MESAGAARKIAILLPNVWRGGMLRNALSLAELIAGHDWDGLGRIGVVIGLRRDGDYDWPALEETARTSRGTISIRRMDWASWPSLHVQRMFPTLADMPRTVSELAIPTDRRHNFLDCDAWIVFGRSTEGHLAPLRPYAVYCADLLQRYVPQIFDTPDGQEQPWVWALQTTTFLGWRAARCVFATTPQTLGDVVGYAGVRASQALLTPTLIEWPKHRPQIAARDGSTPAIVWVTNPAPHKNHAAAVRAAGIYYEELGGTLPLVVVGTGSEKLDPRTGGDTTGARAFRSAPAVLERTRFAGEVSDAAYQHLIGGAAIVWHNVIMDNGTFVAFDAARAGRHLVSSDYPQMRYLCERYGVAPIWHPADDPAAAARALITAEGRFRAGERPAHALREDADSERLGAYGTVLQRLLGPADV